MDGLLINGNNAYSTYGVMMDDGFLDALDAPAGLKDFITFDSRTANGTEYLIKDSQNRPYARVKARDLTLKFRIFGTDAASLQTLKAALLAVFQAGIVTIQVPALNSNVYKLLYTGQSISYGLSADRTTCSLGAKFVEPNPTDRTA